MEMRQNAQMYRDKTEKSYRMKENNKEEEAGNG